MSNTYKLLGAILLVIGTSIGGAMLALPTVIASVGFVNSIFWVVFCWGAMTIGAFCILEINLLFPEDSNLITMAKDTLGRGFGLLTWITYLLLLYTLLSSYVSASGDIFFNWTSSYFSHPMWMDTIVVALVFSILIYKGISVVDSINKAFMAIKMCLFAFLVICLARLIDPELLFGGDFYNFPETTLVIVTSFGYAIIVPTIRKYLGGDIQLLRKSLLIGSLIPLVAYLIWCSVVLGVIPSEGPNGLIAIAGSDHPASAIVVAFSDFTDSSLIRLISLGFYSLCILTSLLGISLCLSDFLEDGICSVNGHKTSRSNLAFLCLMPPLLIALFYPKAFLMGFKFAGYWCFYILIVLPILMVWKNRYWQKQDREYKLWGGKPLLLFGLFLAAMFLYFQLMF